MGSNSDLPTMQAAADILKEFGIAYEIDIVSAHRTPEKCLTTQKCAHKGFTGNYCRSRWRGTFAGYGGFFNPTSCDRRAG